MAVLFPPQASIRQEDTRPSDRPLLLQRHDTVVLPPPL